MWRNFHVFRSFHIISILFSKYRLHPNAGNAADGVNALHANRITMRRASIACERSLDVSIDEDWQSQTNQTFDGLDLSLGRQSTPIVPICILKKSRSVGAIAKNVSIDLKSSIKFSDLNCNAARNQNEHEIEYWKYCVSKLQYCNLEPIKNSNWNLSLNFSTICLK